MRHAIAISLLLFLVLPGTVSPAQSAPPASNGSLSGVLCDPSGALVSGLVVVKNTDAHLKRSTRTDRDGHFIFPALPVGVYELTASAPGFEVATLSAISISAGRETVTEIPLRIAPVRTRIEVEENSDTALHPATDNAARAPGHNAAELLANTPGVSLRTNGALASVPLLHGLGDERVKLSVDGAEISSACANHMNPPLSYASPAAVARIDVQSGVTPVSLGGDNLGGVIAVESRAPIFAAPGERLHQESHGEGFSRSNDNSYGGALSASLGTRHLTLAYNGDWRSNGDYRDGGGHRITSSYAQSTSHSLALAFQGRGNLLTVEGGLHHVPYQGFVNAQMDMTRNWAERLNLHYRRRLGSGAIDARADWQGAWHTMNIGHDKSFFPMPMFMPMQTHGRDLGYAVKADLPLSAHQTLRLGNELHRFRLDDGWPPVAGMAPGMGPETFQSIHNGRRTRLGSYAELASRWSPQWSTLVGLRNDTVWTDADSVHGYSSMYSTDAAAFNAAHRAHTDSNLDASASLRWEPVSALSVDLGYARKSRSPNLYERYAWSKNWMAAGMIGWFGDGNYYVGSTALRPEHADTFSAALTLRGSGSKPWELRLAPFYTRLDDFIDGGVLKTVTYGMSDFSLLQFGNYDARTWGGDLAARAALWQNSRFGNGRLTAAGGWLHGERTADKTPLYQMMPLNLRATLDEDWKGASAGFEAEAVDRKRDLDPRRHEQATAGYALYDAHLAYKYRTLEARGDADNLFNRLYAQPLGGVNFDDFMRGMWMGQIKPLTGRGRSVSFALSARF
jgi:iron complex outermembrane receptor protein